MSDEPSDIGPEETEAVTKPDVMVADFLLVDLVSAFNSFGTTDPSASLGLTLLVGGAVIFGKLIPATVWWKAQSARFREADVGDTAGEALAQALDEIRLEVYGDETSELEPPPGFVHMADVEVHVGTRIVQTPSVRVRIPRVDGLVLRDSRSRVNQPVPKITAATRSAAA